MCAFLHLALRRLSTRPLRTRSAQLSVRLFFKAGLTIFLAFVRFSNFVENSLFKDNWYFMGLAYSFPVGSGKKLCPLHTRHIGLGGCLRRLRECMFWPRMNSNMKDFVYQCDICLTLRDSQAREPLCQHEVPAQPWAKVATDLCSFSGQILLVVTDYFSNFIEVDSLSAETSKVVIRGLMAMFSQYGVPDTLVTDNGPCFASSEFKKFAGMCDFEHVTSTPRYPQNNGKAENAVRTIARLFTKGRAAGISEFQGLLDWRNTPSEGMDTSPAQ